MVLKVAFDDPSDGWIQLTVGTSLRVVASYTPTDPFRELIDALHSSLQVDGTRKVTWHEEPSEVELWFERAGQRIELTAWRFPDHRRPKTAGDRLLAVEGSFGHVCLPFWRALRALRGRRTLAELLAGWHREFPEDALEKLTASVEGWKKSPDRIPVSPEPPPV